MMGTTGGAGSASSNAETSPQTPFEKFEKLVAHFFEAAITTPITKTLLKNPDAKQVARYLSLRDMTIYNAVGVKEILNDSIQYYAISTINRNNFLALTDYAMQVYVLLQIIIKNKQRFHSETLETLTKSIDAAITFLNASSQASFKVYASQIPTLIASINNIKLMIDKTHELNDSSQALLQAARKISLAFLTELKKQTNLAIEDKKTIPSIITKTLNTCIIAAQNNDTNALQVLAFKEHIRVLHDALIKNAEILTHSFTNELVTLVSNFQIFETFIERFIIDGNADEQRKTLSSLNSSSPGDWLANATVAIAKIEGTQIPAQISAPKVVTFNQPVHPVIEEKKPAGARFLQRIRSLSFSGRSSVSISTSTTPVSILKKASSKINTQDEKKESKASLAATPSQPDIPLPELDFSDLTSVMKKLINYLLGHPQTKQTEQLQKYFAQLEAAHNMIELLALNSFNLETNPSDILKQGLKTLYKLKELCILLPGQYYNSPSYSKTSSCDALKQIEEWTTRFKPLPAKNNDDLAPAPVDFKQTLAKAKTVKKSDIPKPSSTFSQKTVWASRISTVLGVGSAATGSCILTEVLTGTLIVGGTNCWNPLGWAALVVGVIAAVVGGGILIAKECAAHRQRKQAAREALRKSRSEENSSDDSDSQTHRNAHSGRSSTARVVSTSVAIPKASNLGISSGTRKASSPIAIPGAAQDSVSSSPDSFPTPEGQLISIPSPSHSRRNMSASVTNGIFSGNTSSREKSDEFDIFPIVNDKDSYRA